MVVWDQYAPWSMHPCACPLDPFCHCPAIPSTNCHKASHRVHSCIWLGTCVSANASLWLFLFFWVCLALAQVVVAGHHLYANVSLFLPFHTALGDCFGQLVYVVGWSRQVCIHFLDSCQCCPQCVSYFFVEKICVHEIPQLFLMLSHPHLLYYPVFFIHCVPP